MYIDSQAFSLFYGTTLRNYANLFRNILILLRGYFVVPYNILKKCCFFLFFRKDGLVSNILLAVNVRQSLQNSAGLEIPSHIAL